MASWPNLRPCRGWREGHFSFIGRLCGRLDGNAIGSPRGAEGRGPRAGARGREFDGAGPIHRGRFHHRSGCSHAFFKSARCAHTAHTVWSGTDTAPVTGPADLLVNFDSPTSFKSRRIV